MAIHIVTSPPDTPCIHLDFADFAPRQTSIAGAVLSLSPRAALRAARRTRRRRIDWVVWGLPQLRLEPRRAAAFLVSLDAITSGDVFFVDARPTAHAKRIRAHIFRAARSSC